MVTGGFGGILPGGAPGVGFSFGIAWVAMAYAIGPVSGAHLNPAVTLGVFLADRLPAKDALPYMIAQIAGAIIASIVLYVIVAGKAGGYDISTSGFGQSGWDPENGFGTGAVFITEVITTFVLVTVFLGVTSERHATTLAGLVIGLTLVALHVAFYPVSGTSLNPARSVAPALFAGATAIGQLWLYIAAPMIGGAIAGLAAKAGLFEQD